MKGKTREVTYAEAEQWAKDEGMLFVEASAKSGWNVEQAFVDAASDILEKIKQGVFDDNRVCLFIQFPPSLPPDSGVESLFSVVRRQTFKPKGPSGWQIMLCFVRIPVFTYLCLFAPCHASLLCANKQASVNTGIPLEGILYHELRVVDSSSSTSESNLAIVGCDDHSDVSLSHCRSQTPTVVESDSEAEEEETMRVDRMERIGL